MFTLYIPDYVLPTDLQLIKDTFKLLEIADVREVVFEPHAEEEYISDEHYIYNYISYGAAHVHINYWYDNLCAENLKTRILDVNQEAKIVYDDPHYWVLESGKDDDNDAFISDINYKQTETDKYIETMKSDISYNRSCILYLLEKDKRAGLAKRKNKLIQANQKHRKNWLKRLRIRE